MRRGNPAAVQSESRGDRKAKPSDRKGPAPISIPQPFVGPVRPAFIPPRRAAPTPQVCQIADPRHTYRLPTQRARHNPAYRTATGPPAPRQALHPADPLTAIQPASPSPSRLPRRVKPDSARRTAALTLRQKNSRAPRHDFHTLSCRGRIKPINTKSPPASREGIKGNKKPAPTYLPNSSPS